MATITVPLTDGTNIKRRRLIGGTTIKGQSEI